MGDGLLDQVIAAELALLRPEVRASRDRLEELLDDDFVEIGASGRRWGRDEIIADLVESPAANVTVERMDVRLVADQIALVTYETVADRRVLRTSWWRERDGTWLCFFHQGAAAPLTL